MRKIFLILCFIGLCYCNLAYSYEEVRLFYKDKTTGDWIAVRGENGSLSADLASTIQVDSMSLTLDTEGLAGKGQLDALIQLLSDTRLFTTDTNVRISNITLKYQDNTFDNVADNGIIGFGVDKNSNQLQVFYIDDKRLQMVDKNSDNIYNLINEINLKVDTGNYFVFYDSSVYTYGNVFYLDSFGNMKVDSDVVSIYTEKVKLPYNVKISEIYEYYTQAEVDDKRLGKLKNKYLVW